MSESQIVHFAAGAALVLLALGMLVAAVRLVRGPDAADRIVALDLISVLIVAFLAALSVRTGHPAVLDVAIAYALVAFLGTVALARWRQRQAAVSLDDEEAS
ncbi:MAG: sodium:proton antiporter [Desulfobacterales bacterium]|nr:sodium:proton antiporter [Desulfobacterales bacterium]